MSIDGKPLFRPEAVRPKVRAFTLPAHAEQGKIAKWAKMFAAKSKVKLKETEVRDEFLYDIFRDVLGYVTVSDNPAAYSFKKEQFVKADGTYADAGFGRFGTDPETPLVVLEGKGPNDPLDRPYAGRKRSAFEQALYYALNLKIDWYLVTNLRETRLYCKQADQFTYERFETQKLATDEFEWKRFVYLLGAERVTAPAGNHLAALLVESAKIGRELTNEFYREYRQLRELTFKVLRHENPTRDPSALLTATQKILDRVLFIAFCEDRSLLPRDIIARAYQHSDPFNPKPIWDNFTGLFKSVDQGNKALEIWQYNGGLYAKDDFLDSLIVPDAVCLGFKKLADYEYGNAADTEAKLIDVEILGHVFEQSISDLEELHRTFSATPPQANEKAEPTKRKKEGAFYTPEFVTRYIVTETLGAVLRDRFEAHRLQAEAGATSKVKGLKALLAHPTTFDPDDLTTPQRTALVNFWNSWLKILESVRVVDPACGSGAFLIGAFDQMFAAYQKAESFLTALGAGSGLFETRKTILTQNLFGMDLNSEAVEIARLSAWIKTAEFGKVLTTLDANIVQGNSVVAEPSPVEGWKAQFPNAFADGGFDVVIGNPPYVRQEWIKADKPFLEKHYRAFDGVADLYVYFYELGLNILKPGGRLGFIVTNKWMKAGYGENLRKLYGESAWLEQVVDFGHAKQIFPDADVFPCILIARKPAPEPAPAEARVCIIPRDLLRIDDLSRQIAEEGVNVPRNRFGPEPWNLEPPGVAKLMDKIKANGIPLKEFAGVVPCRGFMTGFNDAFLIDTPTKEKLVGADPKSSPLFRPYLRGQDIDRWQAEWAGLWMIVMKSSTNHDWPWAKEGMNAEAVFQATYPAIHGHMKRYESELKARKNQVQHWWELSGSSYWDAFDKPKIMYQDITWFSCFGLDTDGKLANNTVYFLPSNDCWLMATLNAPVCWWFAWRTAQHGKDEALRFFTDYVNEFPIPQPTAVGRVEVEKLVTRLIQLKGESTSGTRDVLSWLRAEFSIDKPTQKLATLVELSPDELIAEVKKIRGKKSTLSVAEVKRLHEAHTASVQPLQANAREANQLERRVSDLVNEAYGLTPDDVILMWETAPPRMPFNP